MATAKTTATKQKELDLVFVCDTTGSMSSYLKAAQDSIREISESIVTENPGASVRFGLVEYRDHKPEEDTFVFRVSDFTTSVDVMKTHLDAMSAQGGGDTPEAVVDGLFAALGMPWRDNSAKVVVLIADAPPHGLCCRTHDGFPDGCPCGNDPLSVAHDMAKRGIVVYTVGAEPGLSSSDPLSLGFMRAVAQITSGLFLPLGSSRLLSQVVTGSAVEQLQMRELLEGIAEEVREKKAELGDRFTKEDATNLMKQRMAEQHVTTTQLKVGDIYNGSLQPLEGEWMQYGTVGKIKEVLGKKYAAQPSAAASSAIVGILTARRRAADDGDEEEECDECWDDDDEGTCGGDVGGYSAAAPAKAAVPSASAIRSQKVAVSKEAVSEDQCDRMYQMGTDMCLF